MNLSKPIDISKSSLVGLKAELLKKQDEVKKIKDLQQDYVQPEIIKKKGQTSIKSNKGIDERNLKDIESSDKGCDELRKSRELLEAKSRLYDKLKGNNIDQSTKTKYLVDFDLKNEIYEQDDKFSKTPERSISPPSNVDNYYIDSNSDSENDWVDFVDQLGRSRRCLKKDLLEMKLKDAKLAEALGKTSLPPPPPHVSPATALPGETTLELLSWDMQREMMRKKWEEEEKVLLGKKNIHYQDIRFDEARHHGVGYFEFSVDENERINQQEALKNLRNETVEQQQAAAGLRVRRQQQLAARLAAARRRRRERLGLPPDEEEDEPQEIELSNTEEKQEPKEEVEDIVEQINRIAPIRPWDIGKQGVNNVMSQEEWVDKKRQERPQEFAPPSSLLEPTDNNNSRNNKVNFFTSKQNSNHKKSGHWKTNNKKTQHSLESETKNANIDCSLLDELRPGSDSSFYYDYKPAYKFPSNHSKKETSSQSLCSSRLPNSVEKLSSSNDKNWKPTPEQIDLLLSRAQSNCSNTNTLESKDSTKSESQKEEHEADKQDSVKSVSKSNVKISTGSNSGKMVDTTFNHGPYTGNQNYLEKTAILNEIEEENCNSTNSYGTGPSSVTGNNQQNWGKRKRAEIAPPPSMDYYFSGSCSQPNITHKTDLADSISVGLDYLKSRTKEKNNKRVKGMMDIL